MKINQKNGWTGADFDQLGWFRYQKWSAKKLPYRLIVHVVLWACSLLMHLPVGELENVVFSGDFYDLPICLVPVVALGFVNESKIDTNAMTLLLFLVCLSCIHFTQRPLMDKSKCMGNSLNLLKLVLKSTEPDSGTSRVILISRKAGFFAILLFVSCLILQKA